MRRRPLIIGLGAISAGCIETPMTDSSTNLEISHPPIEELKEDCRERKNGMHKRQGGVYTPEIQVGVDPPGNNVHLDVEVIREFTVDHPAKIRVILGNNGSESRQFVYGPKPISHGQHLESDASLMADWEEETSSLSPDAEGCWRANSVLIAHPVLRKVGLQPGETVTEDYVLVVPKDSTKCAPPGVYHFSGSLEVEKSEDDSTPISLDWALCLF